MKWWWRRRRPELIAGLLYMVARTLGATLRTKVIGYQKFEKISGGKTLLTWHGRTVVAGQFFRNKGFWAIISLSRDGEIQNRIFKRLGYNIIRGSTGRGGERALIESIRTLKNGGVMAITPDGPRGPTGVVQGGVMAMAKKSQTPLIPVGVSARPRTLLHSWDSHLIPWPFARGLIIFGDPIEVPATATAEELEEIRLRVEREMHRLQDQAEEALASGRLPVETVI